MNNNRFIVVLILISSLLFSAVFSAAGVKEEAEDIVSYCKSIAKDKKQAFDCLEEKAEHAKPEVNYAIATLHYKEGNVDRAIASLKKAAKKGYTEAKMELARVYFSDGPYRSCKKTIYWFKEAIQDGNDIARIRLANIYIFKKCDLGSPEEAYELLLPIAQKGNANAQLTVGLMYKDGIGVNSNKKQAEHWLKAAEQNDNSRVRDIARKALNQL